MSSIEKSGTGDRDGLPATERHELGLGGHGELLRGVLLRGVPAALLLRGHGVRPPRLTSD